MRSLLLLLAFYALLGACRKGSSNKLVGEWKLVETSHIGSIWTTINAAQEHTLILKDDGAYILNTNLLSSFSGCKGTYKVELDVMTMSPDCASTPPLYGPLHITVDANTLILDHMITSSGFRTRYIRQ